jgi:hypothetical protein
MNSNEISVAYLCDEKACPECPNGRETLCCHTTDIRHAIDFREVAPGRYMQKEDRYSVESWYARKRSEMSVVRVYDSDDVQVDYDKNRGMYRVSVFKDGHFKDEFWFDGYEESV